ncbi:MAG: peptide chain release factor N(5)-glutamine methyltransferase [Legionella sp.]|nr:MAG: peptide chain release factor N(5)-glutamine methyltransferase [Legionella sp.]
MINIRQALDQGLQLVANTEAALEAEILLTYVLEKNRAYLYAHPERTLTPEQEKKYLDCLNKRVLGTPIAYITGTREFWSLNLKVSPATLIPRHETEQLVELTLELAPHQDTVNVLDLGTGSGAIALALAKERPHWQIDACDLSADALAIAQDNAKIHDLKNVNFYQSNWFSNLPAKKYHAIVANPPYIAPGDPHLQEGDLRFEPINALVSADQGLADIQVISKQSKNFLFEGGFLLLEHGFEQKVQIIAILDRLGYRVQCWQDLQGHDRVTGGWNGG